MIKEYKERIKNCFSDRFLDFREVEDNLFYLYLKGHEFTSLDYNNILQIGWNDHIGFVQVDFTGHINKCLRVHLRAY